MNKAEYHLSDSELNFVDLFELPFLRFEKTWARETPRLETKLFLAADQKHLFYGAEVSGYPTEHRRGKTKGEYVEGLWNADVIELFLFREDSAEYLELNLSPSGAWWAMGFRDYRIRHEAYAPPSGAQTFASRSSEHWRAAISLPQSELSPFLASLKFSGNICAILKGEFFSLATPPNTAPDFHKPRMEFSPREHQAAP